MGKNKKLEKQNHDLFVKFPSLILEIYLEQRANSIGYFNNTLRDYTIKRIDEIYQDTIKMIMSQEYGESDT